MNYTSCVLLAIAALTAARQTASAATFSLSGALATPQDYVTLVLDLPLTGDVTTNIESQTTQGGDVPLELPAAGEFPPAYLGDWFDDNTSPGPASFELAGFGLMCAVCLSFRRSPTPTNGLARLTGRTEVYPCRGAFGSVEAALGQLKTARPNVVLIDIGRAGMSGIEVIRTLKSLCPQAEFLVLTVHDDDGRTFDAMCSGPCGNGGAPLSPEMPRRVTAPLPQVHPPETPGYSLTAQETRVLRLLGEGHHYKTAAADLGITVNTLSFHVRRLYDKMQVHSKSEAVAKALRDGILR